MAPESKTEIVVMSGIAGIAILLWLLTRPATGSFMDGFSLTPPVSTGDGAPTFHIPGIPDTVFNYNIEGGAPIYGANTTVLDSGNPASCGCTGAGGMTMFGSSDALASYLDGTGALAGAISALQSGSIV